MFLVATAQPSADLDRSEDVLLLHDLAEPSGPPPLATPMGPPAPAAAGTVATPPTAGGVVR
jgi:rod shape-determining protein MreC